MQCHLCVRVAVLLFLCGCGVTTAPGSATDQASETDGIVGKPISGSSRPKPTPGNATDPVDDTGEDPAGDPGDTNSAAPRDADPNAASSNGNTGANSPTTPKPAPTAPVVGCPLGQQTNGNIGGPSICCSGSYTLCDDFEAQAVGAEPNKALWTLEKFKNGSGPQYGTVPNDDPKTVIEISDVRAARGTKSLHVRVPNDGHHHTMVVNRSAFPARNNTFWGRVFLYYVSDAKSAISTMHANYVTSAGMVKSSTPYYAHWRLATFSNPKKPTLGFNYSQGDTAVYANANMPENQWACLEWSFVGDATNKVSLYLNGNLITSSNAGITTKDNPKNLPPIYDAFRMGYEIYGLGGNAAYFDMYFDEVALAPTRIGCAN